MATSLTEDSVRKPLATAHTRNTLTPPVHKAISTIIGYSFFFDPDFSSDTKYFMPLDTFYLALDWSGTKNEAWIKHDIFERLRIHPFEWNVLNRDKTIDWERSSVLSTVGIETVDGTRYITYRLNQGFAEKLRSSRHWFIYRLANIASLKRTASISLFEHLFSQFVEIESETLVLVDTLDDIRTILGKEGVYRDYKTFRRDVLEPAIKEIRQKTEIKVTYRSLREGRRVQKIEWTVCRNGSFQIDEQFSRLSLFDERKLPPGVKIPEKAIRLNNVQPLIAKMIGRNLSRKVANELVEKYGAQRCEHQLANLEAKLALSGRGGVKDPAGWLVAAIRDEYGKSAALEEAEQGGQKESAIKDQAGDKKLKAEWNRFRKKRAEERLSQLSEKEMEEQKTTFISLVRETPDTGRLKGVKSKVLVLKYALEKEGDAAVLIEVEFKSWLKHALLAAPEELSFEAYVDYRAQTTE